jgi:para-aminobenzoate synthetase component 1
MPNLPLSYIDKEEINSRISELLNPYSESKTPFLFIIDFDKQQPIVIPLSEVSKHNILYDFKGFTNCNYADFTKYDKDFTFSKSPIPFAEYKPAFDMVQKHLRNGNSYLLNLTFPTPIETSLSLREIFYRSNAPYKLLYWDKFVVFSPEPFIKITGDTISSFPMKGTINKNIAGAEEIIMNDEKEKAEHATIVDLIRNDLSMAASEVTVKRYRYISEVKTYNSELLQVSSEITGKVRKELQHQLGTLLSLLLPAGSITGAPKRKTVEIIKEAEQYERGYFTGVFGYSDGENVESAVMIRFIENINGKLFFKSGGGITIYSEAQSEYKELIDKVYVPIIRNTAVEQPKVSKHILS